jgi:hypothetical protein
MLIARLLVGLLLFAAVLCFALYVASGQKRWRRYGLVIVNGPSSPAWPFSPH